MPNVVADIANGLKLSRNTTGYQLTTVYDCQDLVGANPVEIFASAMKLTSGGDAHTGDDVPVFGELLVINGSSMYARQFEVEAFPPNDAKITVTWTMLEPAPPVGYSPTIVEVGTIIEQVETSFDAANLALDYASRDTIKVSWDKGASGAPGASAIKQTATVPLFAGKAFRRYIRETTTNPETLADQFVARTNSTTWKGLPAGTAMIASWTGRNVGDGKWQEVIDVVRDPVGKFKQVAIFIDPTTGQRVPATVAQLAANNGVVEVTVQASADFNSITGL
jgi:hypothetical protein